MTKDFSKCVEDFTCDFCGQVVQGDGYTNHCPKCLCSKHVDINPGDRQNPCHGLMVAVSYEIRNNAEWITHQCQKCGATMRKKTAPKDARLALLSLSSGQFDQYLQKIRKNP